MPWCTITDSFDADFGVDEWAGTNAFIRDGARVFRTYFITGRGGEALGNTWGSLDMTALGRQESWEDSAPGYPHGLPYEWWRRHDEYDDAPAAPAEGWKAQGARSTAADSPGESLDGDDPDIER